MVAILNYPYYRYHGKIHFFNKLIMPLYSACLKTYKRHLIYVFMFTIDENRAISRYLDSGGGHFGFSHDMGF